MKCRLPNNTGPVVTFIVQVILIAFTLLFNTGCGPSFKNKTFTIGFSQCTGYDLWRRTMLQEMRAELSLHPDIDFVYSDAHGNSQLQIAQISTMLHNGVDLLIISPNEAKPLTGIVDEAYNRNIPVVIIDRKTLSNNYTAYIGSDNREIGKMAAQYLRSITKGPLNIIEITGLTGSSPTIDRDRGFTETTSSFPNVRIVNKIAGDWLRPNAEKELLKISKSLNNVNAVFAQNDDMASAARSVFDHVLPGRDVKIIGVDGLPGEGGGMEMVDKNIINASLVYPTLGKEAIVTALKILNKKPFQRVSTLHSLVVNSTNVLMMKMQWSKINSQQRDIVKQQNLIGEQQIIYKKQQTVLNVIVISLALAIVFGGFALYSSMENRRINRYLEAKNEEIQQQRNLLIEMSAKAQIATEAKLNFFTNVTHEFRTPLTLMLAPLFDLLNHTRIMELGSNNLKMVNQNAYRLLKLVNQLIDYRKIEVDKRRISASENNIVEYVREIVLSFRLYAKKLKVQIHLIPEEKELLVWFDVNLLDKVFFNLLSNAIKSIDREGIVKVYIRKNKTSAIIDIQDNGRGMSDTDAILIFDNFYQADDSPTMGGIGLSLSKEIVELHHGEIILTTKKWEGSSFMVAIPLGEEHFCQDEKISNKNEWPNMDEQSKVYQVDIEEIYDEEADREYFTAPKDLSILIVEDNKDLLKFLANKLSLYFEVFESGNGNDALVQSYEKVPDLILSDVVLPGLSGKSISQKLKTDLRTSHIPIILLTAQTSNDQQIAGMESLADLYISKPFNFDFLLAGINNLLRNRQILKDHFTSDITGPQKLTIAKSLDKKFINDFAGIVEKNLSNENFNVDDLCKTIGISRVQLYRKVRALLGSTVNDYILNRRLKKAVYLLNTGSLSISEITYSVGFSNPNYFSTAFKLRYGCPPSSYRNTKKNK